VILLPYLATVAIMLTGAALLRRSCRNPARTPGRADRLADLTRETVSETLGHQNLAWPPAPEPAAGHVWRITAGRQRCGCVLTTTPDTVRLDTCPAHDPAFVTEWERRLSL
jgi:hypothetical protein